jgi:hypothetical protein
MISSAPKILAIMLLLVSFASSPALACTGSEACSMPCCHSSSKTAAHQDPGAGLPNCCDTSGAGATACSLASKDFVSFPGTHVGFSAALSAVEGVDAFQTDHVRTRQTGCTEEKLSLKTPLYLQIHLLLI